MAIDLQLLGLQLFTGLALGALFILLAVGMSLIFGMLGIVNFAHGAFFMIGCYAAVFLNGLTENFWLCLTLAPLLVGCIGLAVEYFLIRPLYGRGFDDPLLMTFGLAYVLIELVRMAFGSDGIPFPTPHALIGVVNIGVGYFPLYRLFVIAATALLLLALWLLIERTSFGLVIRAGARDPEILRILGIDVGKVWLVIFALGTALSGLAGVLAAPMRSVSPDMGATVLVEAFVVTVIGGMGSLPGAILAGLLVGVVVSLTSLVAPEMATVSMFALMALVLLVRPRGLFGRAGFAS